MTDNFGRGLRELADAAALSHRNGPGLPTAVIDRRARHNRRRHGTAVAAASVAAVAALALAGAAVAQWQTPPPPAVTPTVTPTPTPAPSVQYATKGHADEPDALVMTDATWEQVGPGWALTLFSTMSVIDVDNDYGRFDPAGTQALFLVAPDATIYRMATLPADGNAQIMHWDPVNRKAWLFFLGLGESWYQAEVDLASGQVDSGDFTDGAGPRARYSADQLGDLIPLRQGADGRVLWAGVGPIASSEISGLVWYEPDGSWTPSAINEIGGGGEEAWLDLAGDRIVYLNGAPTFEVTVQDLVDDSYTTRSLGANPDPQDDCSLHSVLADGALVFSVRITCSHYDWGWIDDPLRRTLYEVTLDGEWRPIEWREPSSRLLEHLVSTGPPDLLWTYFASGTDPDLPGHLVAQDWADVAILP